MIRRGKHHRRPVKARSCVEATWTGWGGLARCYTQVAAEWLVDDFTRARTHQTPIEYGRTPR